MSVLAHLPTQSPAGICIDDNAGAARRAFGAQVDALGLSHCVTIADQGGRVAFALRDDVAQSWIPDGDTLQLCRHLDPAADQTALDLEREILVALLAAPRVVTYPSYAEFAAAVRIRLNIVAAARRTELAFGTYEAERPADYWTYDEDAGFTILPGRPLIAALEKATQPEASGTLYSFSCYRATEYVILLGIAQELARVNPPLLERLQAQWETQAIKSGRFHETFLYEYGSMDDPLPPGYYVPGDRLWFRNPDPRSSDIAGYEGSWVFYLGGGLFSNFWKRDQPYTLSSKCVEIFHWRHGVYADAAGELHMDEAIVESRARRSTSDPVETARILGAMQRLRDPAGIYAEGGCIDASREFPRWVCPGSTDIALPDSCAGDDSLRAYEIPARGGGVVQQRAGG